MLANRSIVWSFNPPQAEWTTRLRPFNRFLNASGSDGIPGTLRLVHSIASASACSGGITAYLVAMPVSEPAKVWQASFCQYMRNAVGLPCKVLPVTTISGASCLHDVSASGSLSVGTGGDCSVNPPALKSGVLYVLPVQLSKCAREQVNVIHAATYAVALAHLRNMSRHLTVASARRNGQQSFVGARADLSVGTGMDANWLRYLLNQPLLDLGVRQVWCPAPNQQSPLPAIGLEVPGTEQAPACREPPLSLLTASSEANALVPPGATPRL